MEYSVNKTAQILRIERLSPNDGMGLRTVIFFKGCSMRCKWCSTPESQRMSPELYYQKSKCTLCGKCINTCPQAALYKSDDGLIKCDNSKCISCFKCADGCLSGALGVYGREMTVSQVMKEISKDEIFFYHSGGGITLSGGDVLCQAEFAKHLLIACKDSGIHTMAELDMQGDYQNISILLPYLDAFYADIKLINPSLHKKWTGSDNSTILENTKKAAKDSKPGALHIRTPLIQDITDSKENILATAEFCKSLDSCAELEFLPYHRLGLASYEYTGRVYPLKALPSMSFDEAWSKVEILKNTNYSFPIKVSGRLL